MSDLDPDLVRELSGLGLGDAKAPLTEDDIAKAINLQESSGNAGVGKSSAGAIGGWQIMPGTFDLYKKEGEKIDNPKDNEAVGRRIIHDLWQKAGGDPARVAVGYFSGPDNIAGVDSKTPWKEDFKDTNGTHTSEYVKGILGRMGPSPAEPVVAEEPWDTGLENEFHKVLGPGMEVPQAVASAAPTPTDLTPAAPAQISGPARAPLFEGSQVLAGLAGLADVPRNAEDLGGHLMSLLMGPKASEGAALLHPGPSATESGQQLGLVDNPRLAPQGPLERLQAEGIRGGAQGLPFGPGGVLGGALGNIAAQEGGPPLSAATGGLLPEWAAKLGLGALGGSLGAGISGNVERAAAAGASGASPAVIAGAALPGNPVGYEVEPGTLDTMLKARGAGLDVPAYLGARDRSIATAGAGAPGRAAVDMAYDQFNRLTSQQFGEDLARVTPGDLKAALGARGAEIRQAVQPVQILSGVPAGTQLVNDLGNMELKLADSASDEAVKWFGKQRDKILDLLINKGGIDGEQYFDLTNYGSPISKNMVSRDTDVASVAREMRGALDRAADASLPPEDQGSIAAARFKYRFANALDSAVNKAAPAGNLSPQAVFSSLSREFGLSRLGDYGDVLQSAKLLPTPGAAGGTAQGHRSFMDVVRQHPLAAVLEASGLGAEALQHPQIAAGAAVAGVAAVPLNMAAKALQRKYAASPAALDELVRLSQGGARTPLWAGGLVGAGTGAGH